MAKTSATPKMTIYVRVDPIIYAWVTSKAEVDNIPITQVITDLIATKIREEASNA